MQNVPMSTMHSDLIVCSVGNLPQCFFFYFVFGILILIPMTVEVNFCTITLYILCKQTVDLF